MSPILVIMIPQGARHRLDLRLHQDRVSHAVGASHTLHDGLSVLSHCCRPPLRSHEIAGKTGKIQWSPRGKSFSYPKQSGEDLKPFTQRTKCPTLVYLRGSGKPVTRQPESHGLSVLYPTYVTRDAEKYLVISILISICYLLRSV